MSRQLRIVAVLSFVASAPAAAGDLLQEAAAGHRQMLERISTIHVVLQRIGIDNDRLDSKSRLEWWQDVDMVRFKNDSESFWVMTVDGALAPWHNQRTDDIVSRDWRTAIGPPALRDDASESALKDYRYEPILWYRCGFAIHHGPDTWLKDILQSPDWHRSARQVEMDGRPLIHVECQRIREEKAWTLQVWLDPRNHFLPKKMIQYNSHGPFNAKEPHDHFEVVRFHEPCKTTGIGFPAEITNRGVYSGNKLFVQRIVVESVQINEPIEADVFRRAPPAIGPNGQPIDAEPQLPLLPQADDRPILMWTLYAVIGVALGLACLVALWRWRKAA